MENLVSSYLDPNKGRMLKTIFFSEKLLALKSRKELQRIVERLTRH